MSDEDLAAYVETMIADHIVTEEDAAAARDVMRKALARRHEPQWDAFLNGVFGG